MNKSSTYGVFDSLSNSSVEDLAVAELEVNGYTLIPSGIKSDEIKLAKLKIDLINEVQVGEIGKDALVTINDVDNVRCLVSYDDLFLKISSNNALISFARRILGENIVLLMQNGIINKPKNNNSQSRWHRDLNYQHFVCSQPLAINALLMLDDFTEENGATLAVPATHKLAPFPGDLFCEKFKKTITGKAGDFLILNAMLFHAAGINVSSKPRYAVNHVIGKPFLGQQISIPEAINRNNAIQLHDDEFLRSYLGYKWNPADSALDWRIKKL